MPSCLFAATGLSLPVDSTSEFKLTFDYKQPDSIPSLEIGSLLHSAPATPALRTATPSLDLGTLLPSPRSSLQCDPDTVTLALRTFRAFQNQDQVVKTWNRDILLLMKKSDREKSGPLRIGVELPSAVASVVGEGGAGLQVSGRQRISFAGRSQWSDVTSVSSLRQSKFPSLIMQQENSFTVEGTIGSKVSVKVDQDSKRQTDLENRIQIRYKGDEDDILRSVEAGNTTLSLPNTQFVGYSQRIQGLFGFKAAATVGPVDLTMITSQEKGNTVRNRVTAGANQTDVTLRDYQYSANRIFDLGRIGRAGDEKFYLGRGDTIVNFILYKTILDQTAPQGAYYYDAIDSARYPGEGGLSRWAVIGVAGYVLSPDQHYIYFPPTSGLQDIRYSAVAYYMRVKKSNGEMLVFGDTSVAPYRLQLLKPIQPKPDDPLWSASWKNVYDLGIRNIKYEELTTLDVKRGPPGTETTDDAANLNHQNGVPYLQLLGLDRYNQDGGGGPDGRTDNIRAILNLDDGLLIFPNREPFAPPPGDTIRSVKYPDSTLGERVPDIYAKSNDVDLKNASKYYIKMTTRRRVSSFPLGRVNIMTESEVVTLNGTRLARGPDYTIDYDLGTITFLRQEALDPNSQLTIDYEYAPFMSLDKRSLFGMRGEYKAGPDFHTGATFLYKGSKSTNRPAQLGQEPFRDMVLDYDVYWRSNAPFLTRLVDALPLVKTSAQSNITFGAEIARSLPNPNTKGRVLIDDFESAKRAYSFGTGRARWTIASPPLDPLTSKVLPGRGLYDPALLWFNPYTPFPETAIYRRDVRRGTANNAQVLVLEFHPEQSRLRDSAGGPWGGIMCALPTGAWDQSRAEYLELRMAVAWKAQVRGTGNLHIDLGRITEDVNGNGKLDTEDGIVTGLRNSLLDVGEDLGLDTIPDVREIGPDSARYDPVSNPDPAGDNWAAPVRGTDGRDNYDHINGTEGSAGDADRYGIPDTEDIGGQSETDYVNSYFSFNVDLGDPKSFKVDSSGRRSRDVTGYTDSLEWTTYRIPLWDYAARLGTSLDSNDIQFARIWMDGTGQDVRVYIAAISLVQNTWKASVDSLTARTDTLGVKRFGVAVKNTEENRDYTPPPGVGGFVDANGVREKEQSLILTYSNFLSGDSGHARLASSVAQDFTGYRQLTLFVRGNETADTNSRYYFRFGQDQRNYYYYSDVLDYNRYRAESGWQSMVVDLDRATVVKENERQKLLKSGRTDTLNVFDSTSHIGVRGLPSLSRIGYMEIGVVRAGTTGDPPDSGEVWFDELRLDGVRRDQGTAARATLTTQLADLMGFTASVDTRNYAFRTLNEGRSGSVLNSSGQLRMAVNGNVTLSKFIPDSWGFSLPVSLSYSRDVATPKLLTGSDVVLNRAMQDSLQTRRESQSISTNVRWSPPNAPVYFKYTLGALTGNFNVSRQVGRSPNVPSDKSENYNAGATYALQFKNRGTFSPLSWTRFLLLPRSLYGTKFSVLPTTFTAAGNYARTHQMSVNSNNDTTRIDSRLFSGNAKIGLAPIPALTASWDMTTSRNLSNPRDVNLAFNPKEFQLGSEQSFRQRVSADYKPFVVPFLTHGFTYSADFSDQIENVTVTDRVGIPNGSSFPGNWGISVTSRVPSHNVQLNRQYSANGTLDVAKLWTFLGRKEVKRGSAKPARTKSDTKKSGPGKEGAKKGLEKDLELDLKEDSKPLSGQETHPPEDQPPANGQFAGSQPGDQRPPGSHEPVKSGVYGPPTPDSTKKTESSIAHSGGFGPVSIWRGFLDGLDWITTPIGPLSVTYAHSDAITQNSLSDRPGLGFQFGFATDTSQLPPVVITSSSPGRVPTRNGSDRIDVKNNLKLGNILTIGNGYGWSMSRRQQSGSSNYTFSESFPVLSTSFERLERITPVGWIFTNASVRTAYNHKYDEAGNGPKRSSVLWTSKSWSSGFSPLVSVNGTIHKTIRFGFSMTDTKSHSEQNQKQSRPTDAHSTTWDVNLDYSFSSPKGIPIPLLRGIRLKSQMTMSVRVSGKSSQSFIVDTSGVSRPVERSSDLSVAPQANYSFSTRVKGGFTAQWSDSKSNGRKNHTRSLALWAEFTF